MLSFSFFVPSCFQENTYIHRIIEFASVFITGKLRRSLVFVSTSLVEVIWVASVYLFHTHTVCLAWQPAGVDNNKASVRSKTNKLMAWGTQGDSYSGCLYCQAGGPPGKNKSQSVCDNLENQCVSCVLVSLPFPWLRSMLAWQFAGPFERVPIQRLTWLSYYRWQV